MNAKKIKLVDLHYSIKILGQFVWVRPWISKIIWLAVWFGVFIAADSLFSFWDFYFIFFPKAPKPFMVWKTTKLSNHIRMKMGVSWNPDILGFIQKVLLDSDQNLISRFNSFLQCPGNNVQWEASHLLARNGKPITPSALWHVRFSHCCFQVLL